MVFYLKLVKTCKAEFKFNVISGTTLLTAQGLAIKIDRKCVRILLDLDAMQLIAWCKLP